MANCCWYFLFYSFSSGLFFFAILGLFALTNNPYIFIENLHLEKDAEPVISDDTKKQIYLQYFSAAFFDAIFALLIYIFIIMKERKKKPVLNENIVNLNEEDKIIENKQINNSGNPSSENIISKEGMSESEPLI